MSSTASGFPDYGSTFKVFEIVGEFLSSGKGVAAGEHIDVNVGHSRSLNMGLGPELMGGIGFADIEAVEMNRLVEKVAGDKLDHAG